MYALEFAGVSKHYGSRHALDSIDLVVPSGSSVGLLGPNGAGKTTTLRLLLGFTRPSVGAVRLRGLDPYHAAARQGVGHLPENLRLPGRMRVRGFLRIHGAITGLRGSELDRAVDERLEQVGLGDRGGERVSGLSKGLSQRLGFAQAMIGRPEVLLLDEPTTGLDPIGIRNARGWIESAREAGTTLVVSSHVLSEVERTCDQVVIMNEGRLAASGPLDELVQPGESLEDVFVRAVGGDRDA